MDRILLLLDRPERRRQLESRLARHYQVLPAADPRHPPSAAFDLAVMDRPTLERLWEQAAVQEALVRQEAELRATLYSIGDAVISTDAEGRVVRMNPVAERLTGWTEAEAIGKLLDEVFHIVNEETRREVESPATRVLREGVVVGLANHTLLIARDGKEYPIADAGAPIFDAQGQVTGVVLVFRDRTEERRAQRAVEEARQFAESIIATLREPLVVLDAGLRVVSANRAFYRTFQVTPEETEGQLLYDLGERQWDIPELRQLLEEILPQNTSFDDYAVTHDFPHLGRRTMLLNARRIYREANKTQLILLAMEDITERVRAEEDLRLSERRFRELFQATPVSCFTFNRDGVIQDWNRACETLYGWTAQEAVGKSMFELMVQEKNAPKTRETIAAIFQGHAFEELEYKDRRADGSLCTVLANEYPLHDSSGEVALGICAQLDITERVRAETALKEGERFLNAVLESIQDGISILDTDLTVRHVNGVMKEWYVENVPLEGKPCYACYHNADKPCDPCPTLRSIQTGRVERDIVPGLPGSPVEWIELFSYPMKDPVSGEVTGVVEFVRDITERVRHERELEAEVMLAQALGESLELEPLLERLLQAARHAVPAAEKGSILLAAPDGRLRIRALNGYQDPRLLDFAFASDLGYSARAARERRPLLITDARADPEIRYDGEIEEARDIHSAIVAPLLIQERLIGVISLDATRQAAFDEQDLSVLTTFAASAALILENARLFQETEQRLAELKVLHQAGQQLLAAHLDPEETYAAVHRAVAQVMPCEAFVIVLGTPSDENSYQAVYLYDKGGRYPSQPVPRGQGLSGQVISGGKTLLVNDFTPESDLPAVHFGEEEHVRAILAVPLQREEQTIGMISAQSYQPHAYDERHRVLLETLAAQFGAAIENAHLYQQTRQRLREVELVAAVSAALRAADSRAEVLSAALDQLIAGLEIDGAAIEILDPVSGDLTTELGKGVWTLLTGVTIPAGKGISAQVLDTQQPYLSNDVRSDPRLFRPDAIGECRAAAGVPLIAQDRIVGLLWAGSHRPLTQDDLRLLTAVGDITANAIQRITLQEQMRVQAHQMAQILATVPMGVLLLDAQGRVLQVNPTAEKDLAVLTGPGVQAGDTLTHLGGRPLAELLTSPPTKGLWHQVEADTRIFEVIARPMENGPEPEYWVLVVNDVTRERDVRAQLERQERLAAVGQLAAGIAHDFNNIMATIILYARMLERTEGLSEQGRERLNVISQQGWHATRLIEQILDFSRRSTLERKPLDLLPLVKEQVKLLERTLPENIQIDLSFGRDEYIVNADPTRMQQMLTNLAVNARDAMPHGGRLRIALERVTLESGKLPVPDMQAGEWIRLTISDTGVGIAPDVLPHIFEPFFTTKAPGEGSGLGLAQVHGIVGQHEGHINVESQVGAGTTFTLYLPALAIKPTHAPTPDAKTVPLGRGEIVLVVEDDATLRDALKEILESLNYRTLEAANGQEALALMEAQGEQIALVLSDVVMPGMGGVALFHALRDKGRQTLVILLTGHPMEKELEALLEKGLSAWLNKPPDVEQLAQVLDTALHSAAQNA